MTDLEKDIRNRIDALKVKPERTYNIDIDEYGLRWSEFKRDRLVTKEKIFNSEHGRERFIRRIQKKNNFNCIISFFN